MTHWTRVCSGVLRCEDADASPIHPEVGGGGLTAGPVVAGLSVDCWALGSNCSNHTLNVAPSDLMSKEALLASRMWQKGFRRWWPWEVSTCPTHSGSDSLTSVPRLAAGECGNPEGVFWRRRWVSPGQRVRQESRKLGLHAEMAWCYSKSNEHAPRGLVLLCPVISDFLWWGIFKSHPPLFYYEVFHIFKTVYSIYIHDWYSASSHPWCGFWSVASGHPIGSWLMPAAILIVCCLNQATVWLLAILIVIPAYIMGERKKKEPVYTSAEETALQNISKAFLIKIQKAWKGSNLIPQLPHLQCE